MIGDATHDAASAAMVRAIVDIAHDLDVEVIAQGIETEAQRDFLSSTAAARMAQGFYYSEPVTTDRATELLRQRRLGSHGGFSRSLDHAEAETLTD